MRLCFASEDTPSLPLHLIEEQAFHAWFATQDPNTQNWLTTSGFTGGLGQVCVVADGGHPVRAVVGYGTSAGRKRGRFHLAGAVSKLPEGTYDLVCDLPPQIIEQECLGWLLAGYRFDRYRAQKASVAQLKAPSMIDKSQVESIATAEALTRDLINTPASDMGPAELEQAARDLAAQHGASISVTTGEDLLEQGFPLIHTVGRASTRSPRLIDMTWGQTGPTVTLVGKGVCFDTGGLNLKPGASMGLMKKDMGGAAAVLGLAAMIMSTGLPVQLRVLIPAVENAVSGEAFRPQDILPSRKGLTVEINNTDAEGRLVLADALALAEESAPDLLISMATLTGAARVAVGPDLAPFYATDDTVAQALVQAANQVADPVWRMPFWDPYEKMIEPGIADLDNAPKGGFAGSITAALFLRRFVNPDTRYVHFDIYGWQPAAAPARPKGGVGQGARAIFAALPDLLGLR
jgi:leucyl aminopeptidase